VTEDLPTTLPISAVMTFCPFIAALILVYREDKGEGVRRLLKRIFDYHRIKNRIWYAPIVLLNPAIYLLAYGVMRLMGRTVPDLDIPLLLVPVFFVAFFVGAAGEEVGWMGYAIDPMQERWGALPASIILGVVWTIWHLVPFLQADHMPAWWRGSPSVCCRPGSSWSGCTTTPGKAYLRRSSFTPWTMSVLRCFHNTRSVGEHITIRLLRDRSSQLWR
jgi:membrane protease YdiL (CAAX protease family)